MITLIDNCKVYLKDKLLKYYELSDEVIICSPFISSNDLLFELLDGTSKITLICRLSHPLTPDLLKRIYSFVSTNKEVYVYDDSSLHSKIYLFKKDNKPIIAIVGSSNFTEAGINANKEFNICFDEKLEEVEKYLEYIKEKSYEKLNKETISYFQSIYRKPMQVRRFKKAKIKNSLVEKYHEILDKYGLIKGVLCNYNKLDLPFTYVFDAFVHYFKTEIKKDYNLEPFKVFDKTKLIKYFQIFLNNDYFPKDNIKWRYDRYHDNLEVRENIDGLPDKKIKKFILRLHSINHGSGSGNRRNELNKTNVNDLKELLKLFIDEKIDMAQKYALALTPKSSHGYKVPYLGPSAIGEIPGWLFPDLYPIKNSKLLFIYGFFKI
ncbi:NgoFVII family restriction endonuclease [bacterium]|nr:NgoFVII family restriction endonuclease [bacterium]